MDHLAALTAHQRRLVYQRVAEQLIHAPTVETRNRKLMRPNPLAAWELRIRQFRVFYDVALEPEPLVLVVAVGVKDGSELRIGGERFFL